MTATANFAFLPRIGRDFIHFWSRKIYSLIYYPLWLRR